MPKSEVSLQLNPNISGDLGLPNRYSAETKRWVLLSTRYIWHILLKMLHVCIYQHTSTKIRFKRKSMKEFRTKSE